MIVEARAEHRQRNYRVRLEWGLEGAALLAAECAVVVIVAATGTALFAGCLRNASAVAAAAETAAQGGPIGVVPAGERWPGGTLRVAVEDAIGAGAIVAALSEADRSPEAELAATQFTAARLGTARSAIPRSTTPQLGTASTRGLAGTLAATASGRELIADGYRADIELAAAYDTSRTAPTLHDDLLVGAR